MEKLVMPMVLLALIVGLGCGSDSEEQPVSPPSSPPAVVKDDTPERPEGEAEVSYWLNGTKQREVRFLAGGETLVTTWFVTGELESEGKEINGLKEGTWKWWYENGIHKSEALFKAGKRLSWKKWGPDGTLLKTSQPR